MTTSQKISLLLLRISLAWIFLYSGATKIINPDWSAAGYLKGAQTLAPLYNWFAGSQNIAWVNFLNEWGQLLIGVSLILGIFTRPAAVGGILLMILYYIPALHFPYAGAKTTYLLIDDHIIFTFIFLLLYKFDAGSYFGLKPLLKKYFPKFLQSYF